MESYHKTTALLKTGTINEEEARARSNKFNSKIIRQQAVRTDPDSFNKMIALNMSGSSKERGGNLTPEEARAIWLPLIAANNNCHQCGIEVAEKRDFSPRQASPQRPNPLNPSYVGNCVVFCMYCQHQNMNTPDSEISTLFSSVFPFSDPLIRLPSDWNPSLPVPGVPDSIPNDSPVDPAFLKWLDQHIGIPGKSRGLWFNNENYKEGKTLIRDVTITVTRGEVIKLWRANGGNWCRWFGIRGNWSAKSPLLLTIDKIDPTQGYVAGNLMIMLVKANNGKWTYGREHWADLMRIRDSLLERFS